MTFFINAVYLVFILRFILFKLFALRLQRRLNFDENQKTGENQFLAIKKKLFECLWIDQTFF